MLEYKVVVLGSGGVGKSALTVKFVYGRFVERYDPTIEDFYRREIVYENKPSLVEILDTAGTEQFASMRDLYIKNGEGFVIVFSLISQQTFSDIIVMKDNIMRVKGGNPDVPIVLVGNKSDLKDIREVSKLQAEELASLWGCTYVEASAKTDPSVEGIFLEIVKEIARYRTKPKRKCILL